VAEALTEGEISPAQARMITDTLRRLPAAVGADERTVAEQDLVDRAKTVDPGGLRTACQQVLERADPDGALGSTAVERARNRSFVLGRQDRTGMYPVSGRLDPQTGAFLRAALDPWAGPQPDPDGTPDRRTVEQRDHDALGELARRALTVGDRPVRHGCPVTVIVTITVDQLEERTGCGSTAHGGRYPVRELLRRAADAAVIPAILDSDGQILHFGAEQRLATEAQRRALQLLDKGCVYQGCTVPGVWCQTAHTIPFRILKRTDLEHLALLCGYHHHKVDDQGWTMQRVRGRVWLTPPLARPGTDTPNQNQQLKPLQPGEIPPEPAPTGGGDASRARAGPG
jgi:hypothetical protein